MFDRVCEIELDPWTEVIGTLEEIDENSIIVAVAKQYRISLSLPEIEKLIPSLKKGSLVRLMMTPRGWITVRYGRGDRLAGQIPSPRRIRIIADKEMVRELIGDRECPPINRRGGDHGQV